MACARLSDKREGGWPREPKRTSIISRLITKLTCSVRRVLEVLQLIPNTKHITDHWAVSQNRYNILITMKLWDKSTNQCFAIGNYHMPCSYYAPMIMTIHTDMAARHIQRLASSGKYGAMPYILAGDWNIKPDGSSYRLLTTGQMDKGDPEWPTPKHGVEWKPTAQRMKSAYAVKDGKEPNFTNYARVKEEEPFIDTLDYIFLSDGDWIVRNVKALPHRDEVKGPFPNLDVGEPSDHILIAAELELKKRK